MYDEKHLINLTYLQKNKDLIVQAAPVINIAKASEGTQQNAPMTSGFPMGLGRRGPKIKSSHVSVAKKVSVPTLKQIELPKSSLGPPKRQLDIYGGPVGGNRGFTPSAPMKIQTPGMAIPKPSKIVIDIIKGGGAIIRLPKPSKIAAQKSLKTNPHIQQGASIIQSANEKATKVFYGLGEMSESEFKAFKGVFSSLPTQGKLDTLRLIKSNMSRTTVKNAEDIALAGGKIPPQMLAIKPKANDPAIVPYRSTERLAELQGQGEVQKELFIQKTNKQRQRQQRQAARQEQSDLSPAELVTIQKKSDAVKRKKMNREQSDID